MYCKSIEDSLREGELEQEEREVLGNRSSDRIVHRSVQAVRQVLEQKGCNDWIERIDNVAKNVYETVMRVMHASYSERQRAKSEEFVRRTAKENRERSMDKQSEYANVTRVNSERQQVLKRMSVNSDASKY
jgi:hypothetical protein